MRLFYRLKISPVALILSAYPGGAVLSENIEKISRYPTEEASLSWADGSLGGGAATVPNLRTLDSHNSEFRELGMRKTLPSSGDARNHPGTEKSPRIVVPASHSHLETALVSLQKELPTVSVTDGVARPPLCPPSPLTPEEVRDLVVESAVRNEVDIDFAVAVAFVESGFDRMRNSPKGARGAMQLMPSTAKRFDVLDVCDARQNIDAGVLYLRELNDKFKNPLIVAAAYNAGEARIDQYGGIPPFMETVSYVAKVINYQIGNGSRLGRRLRFTPAQTPTRGTARRDAGVTKTHPKRTFIGGVMHF